MFRDMGRGRLLKVRVAVFLLFALCYSDCALGAIFCRLRQAFSCRPRCAQFDPCSNAVSESLESDPVAADDGGAFQKPAAPAGSAPSAAEELLQDIGLFDEPEPLTGGSIGQALMGQQTQGQGFSTGGGGIGGNGLGSIRSPVGGLSGGFGGPGGGGGGSGGGGSGGGRSGGGGSGPGSTGGGGGGITPTDTPFDLPGDGGEVPSVPGPNTVPEPGSLVVWLLFATLVGAGRCVRPTRRR